MSKSNSQGFLATFSLLFSVTASAADQSYMSLVGDLVANVEAPRILRDLCLSDVPSSATANAKAFESWVQGNAELLKLVAVQRERADKRLATQAASNASAPKSTDQLVEILRRNMKSHLQKAEGSEHLTLTCADYPSFLSFTAESRGAKITELLKLVTSADVALSEREAKK